MRIAVDARELAGRPTGVGRYLGELLGRWAGMPDALRHQWRLFTHEAIAVPEPFAGAVTVVPSAGGTTWEQWRLPRALASWRPDVLFAPAYTAPATAPCPVVVTIHDVSFMAHPEWFRRREGLRRRWLAAWSARRARLVLTDSAFSREEIARHTGVAADKLRVIPLGAPSRDGGRDNARDVRRDRPVVLYVGSIFERRHVSTLVAAFATVVAPALPHSRLEIVGENRMRNRHDLAAKLATLPPEVACRIRLRSYVDEPTLDALYREASTFAFLSEYEGFGLPPLEALAAGVPPVVLDVPIAREVYGPAARYVSAPSPEPVGAAILELLTSAEARQAILDHAPAVLARYDWGRTARLTLEALEEAAFA